MFEIINESVNDRKICEIAEILRKNQKAHKIKPSDFFIFPNTLLSIFNTIFLSAIVQVLVT